MVYYLILCRSLTYAQRTASVLERAGIAAYLMRAPAGIHGDGCSHAVKIAESRLVDALTILRRVGLPYQRVFILMPDGGYKEVRL